MTATAALAAQSVTMNPNHGPTTGFTPTITITGMSFGPGASHSITLAYCQPGSVNSTTCTAFNSDTSNNLSNAGGATITTFTVTSFTAAQSGSFACNLGSACVLYVGTDLNGNFTNNNNGVLVPYTYDAPPATLNNVSSTTPQGPINVVSGGATSAQFNVNYGAANDSNGQPETITPPPTSPTAVVTGPAHGAVSNPSPGVWTYTSDNTFNAAGGVDSFIVKGATVTCGNANCSGGPLTGNNVTINVNVAQKPAGIQTTLTKEIDSTHLQLGNAGGMSVGDTLVVNPGGANQETVTITGFTAGNPNEVVVTPALAQVHNPGEAVADSTTQAGSSLGQVVTVPVTPGTIQMSEPQPTPTDSLIYLNNQVNGSGPAESCHPVNGNNQHVATGQPFFACGALYPVTIINPGTDAGFTVSGSVTDFLDSKATAGTTCDSIASYNLHCIPAGNLQWGPVAAIAHDLVPGDVANITAGPALANVPYFAAAPATSAALARYGVRVISGSEAQSTIGSSLKTGWVAGSNSFGVAPATGMHTGSAQTLCQTFAGTSNGTFVCGANLELAVPASASATGTAFTATVTLTLA